MIIAGFGRFGQIVGRMLRMRRHLVHRARTSSRRSTSCAASATRCTTATRRGSNCCSRRRRRAPRCSCSRSTTSRRRCAPPSSCSKHFPHLTIFARARNRQHAFRLMDLGVRYLMRETYLSSLDLAQHTLEALGLARARSAREHPPLRRARQEAAAGAARDPRRRAEADPAAQQAARELEQLFESDTAAGAG